MQHSLVAALCTQDGDDDDAAEARLAELLPGGLVGNMHFNYVKQWWPHRSDPNVLLLHYADAVADPAANIRRIATFVGLDLTDIQVARIANLTSLRSMRNNSLRFS